VSTDWDEAGLLIGNSDPSANIEGQDQADIISEYFLQHYSNIEFIYSSDATRLKKITHKIRVKSKDNKISSLTPRVFKDFRERNFGVLNRTSLSMESDVFSLSRIKPEGGESVFECRVRLMKIVLELLQQHKDRSILVISHPFACQIVLNVILQKDHTLLTSFWQNKGSFVALDYEYGKYEIKWNFKNGYNAIFNKTYNQNEIYSDLLGKKRAFSS